MSMLYSSETPSSYSLICSNGSSSDCAPCVWTNLSALPAAISGTIPVSEDPRIETLRRYSYGVALPSICLLGIVGNIFNLIVLTRRNMRGTAYIYMRGGKMHLRAGEYEKAYTDFFEAFKNYDESGNPRRLACLKYLILNSMLMQSAINPFDSQEAKPYAHDPEIRALTLLIDAFQNSRTSEFVQIFEKNKESLMADPFIREHLEELLKSVRGNALVRLIKPYRNVKLSFISGELGMDEDEVENLLVSYILDGHINGKIDQVNRVLRMTTGKEDERYEALNHWTSNLSQLLESVIL